MFYNNSPSLYANIVVALVGIEGMEGEPRNPFNPGRKKNGGGYEIQ
jgi:hypothetical protein